MGGFNAAGVSLNTVYVFDGSRWASGPRLPLPLDHSSAATLGDRLYIAGGHSNGGDSARLFRLDGTRWTELASMHHARGGHAVIAANGRLYAIVGNTVLGNVATPEVYDPGANRWTVLPALPQPRNHVAGFVLGGLVCVAGRRSPNTPRVDCLDTSRLTWSRRPDLPRATSGGGDAVESRMVDQLATYLGGSRWSATQRMLSPRHGFELAMFNGRAWACGGGSAPGLHPVATCTSFRDPPSLDG